MAAGMSACRVRIGNQAERGSRRSPRRWLCHLTEWMLATTALAEGAGVFPPGARCGRPRLWWRVKSEGVGGEFLVRHLLVPFRLIAHRDARDSR